MLEFYRVYKKLFWDIYRILQGVQSYFGTCVELYRVYNTILGHIRILPGVQKLFWDIYRILQGAQSYFGTCTEFYRVYNTILRHDLRSYWMNIKK